MSPLADMIVLDVTHSLQKPGADSGTSGGCREHAVHLARAGAAWGIDALFIETHPDPDSALSDSATMVLPETAEEIVRAALKHWEGIRR
jgi:2-dehydro-3-deoxyphosphooctonate aldolase (KDO 8-P synthase)